MSTKLEKYLKENRSGLDVEYPDDDRIWSGITNSSVGHNSVEIERGTRKLLRSNFWRAAAIVTLFISLSYITFDIVSGGSPIGRKRALASINEDLGEQESNYLRSVKYKQKEIRELDIPDNEIINSLFDELKSQDKLYDETIEDLEDLGNNDQMINTVFNIYERKIELLERIIIETNKTYNNEKDNEVNI